jgi:hypothetical protein
MNLHLGEGLSFPIEAATQTFLIVGKRGSGKTTTCVRLAEQFFKAHVPFVVVDPVDTWYGLKSSRDGKSPGLGVYVFGGKHADLPLEPTAGVLIADAVIEHNFSAVLSIKHFSGRERGRFVADFTARLFQKNTAPRHLFLEEAHEVAPQNPFKGEEEMLGHVTRIWKLGRSSGLGGSAITQRPASLSKNITTQAEILIVHRTLGPQDVAAIREWIRYHGEREDILAQLSTLKTGEAFIWAPDFPEGKPIGLQRIKVLDRETFDSSATPRAGHQAPEPKRLADVDLEALRQQMAATIERAKAEDPRELRRQLAEAHKKFAEAQKELARLQARPAITAPPECIEVPVITEKDRTEIGRLVTEASALATKASAYADSIKAASFWIGERLQQVGRGMTPPASTIARNAEQSIKSLRGGDRPVETIRRPAGRAVPLNDGPLPPGERAILIAAAQYEAGVTREQLSVLAGYRRSSRDAYVARLQTKGYVLTRGGSVFATDEGVRALGPAFEALPTGRALRDYWLGRLPVGERAVLEAVIRAYPKPVHREALEEAIGYRRSSRDAYIQRLRARRVIEIVGRGEIRASETLFG